MRKETIAWTRVFFYRSALAAFKNGQFVLAAAPSRSPPRTIGASRTLWVRLFTYLRVEIQRYQ